MKKLGPVKVKQNEEAPLPVEVIADSIKAISDGIKTLRRSRLNDKALMLLIQHACPGVGAKYGVKTKPTINEVRAVIAGIEGLEREYLKP